MTEQNWSLEDLIGLGEGTSFTLSENLEEQVKNSHFALMKMWENNVSFYGSHTGFGRDIDQKAHDDWCAHQKGLLSFLQVGVGEALDKRVVRRALRLQALKCGLGLSGIHPETVKRLVQLSNEQFLPTVPRHGSLGASGDLVSMAHAVAPIFEGYDPQSPRDVLALVNTNAMMASFAIELYDQLLALYQWSNKVTAAVSLALGVQDEAFKPSMLAAGVVGEKSYYKKVGEQLIDNRQHFRREYQVPQSFQSFSIQERYSVRCAPQVLANGYESLQQAWQKIAREALSVADNPLVGHNLYEHESSWHGGKFYSVPIASAVDMMNDVLFRCCDMVDRQTFLLVSPETSYGLPANLQVEVGEHVKGIHQLISALMQRIRGHSTTSYQMATPAEAYNQDILPATMERLIIFQQAIETANNLLAGASLISERAIWMRYHPSESLPEKLYLKYWRQKFEEERKAA